MHTCSRASASTNSKQRKGTPGLVATVVKELYPGRLDTSTPHTVMLLVKQNASVSVSYSTAWRGVQQAKSLVRGYPADSYRDLYSYLYMLQKVNPGTKHKVLLDEQGRFKYLFVALEACVEGFVAMRKVLVLAACQLVLAACQDGSRHYYPIAFGVIDSEKNDSWEWYFRLLKTVIPDNLELVIVSDRNLGLINAVAEVYTEAKHGYCTWHLSQNVKMQVQEHW
ncbi:uncharacterized protein LOC112088392 [Eutrema salsugineum]|uniref:uncharacterized protein LOC112088392 n=1 Tax=Eutrema salsugineum TaxID=72664 RepID=UPI000CECF933|nr:uncharacterized protein LOC112088392 [Eutrema salsugineum]